MSATFFALALAAAALDVTVGYPERLRQAIGDPALWLTKWLRTVEIALAGLTGPLALVVYLAPAVVGAAAADVVLPDNAIGFALRAVLTSTLCGRQSVDRRARAAALAWERDGAGEALVAAEALGPQEDEMRLAPAAAAALAARFADEVVAPTMYVLLGGMVGAAFCRALAVAARDRRDTPPARAANALARWTLAPAARLAGLWLAAASGRRAALAASATTAARPTQPAEATMLAALGPARRDEPAYLRRALALFRRAAALELATLAVATAGAAFFF